MCGIAGFYGEVNWDSNPRSVLERMVAAIHHRGPDDWGTHIERNVGLGHARLSIIDLALGRQPMADPEETLWITYNGEIFNYLELRSQLTSSGSRFRTQSDTEVILHAYRKNGPDCVTQFNGDFAFAVGDSAGPSWGPAGLLCNQGWSADLCLGGESPPPGARCSCRDRPSGALSVSGALVSAGSPHSLPRYSRTHAR